MNCKKCGSKSKTIDSHPYAGTRYRLRECLSCKAQFWTVEDEPDPAEVAEMLSKGGERCTQKKS